MSHATPRKVLEVFVSSPTLSRKKKTKKWVLITDKHLTIFFLKSNIAVYDKAVISGEHLFGVSTAISCIYYAKRFFFFWSENHKILNRDVCFRLVFFCSFRLFSPRFLHLVASHLLQYGAQCITTVKKSLRLV